MQIYLDSIDSLKVRAYFVFQDGAVLSPSADAVAQLRNAEQYEAFCGKSGQVACIRNYTDGTAYAFVGIGNTADTETLRRATAKLVEWAESKQINYIGISCQGMTAEMVRAVSEAVVMSSYLYTECLTKKPEKFLEKIILDADSSLSDALNEGVTLGTAVNIARDLVNEPSNIQTPVRLANEAKALGERFGFTVEVLDKDKIQLLKMDSLYQVSKGSPNDPAVIVMRYLGNPENPQEITGLIGKGVTYDSGGLNLKSGQRFTTMKHDMAGGATVIGAVCAAAAMKLRVNVVAVVAACENLISGQSYKPGDIISSMAGKTIQINSTDAEGRLTMIDAITYAVEYEKVTRIIDIATLTGAARRILGEYGAPVLGNDDSLWNLLAKSASQTDEVICRVPLIEDARPKIRGNVSDLLNTSLSETAGMVTAALFIEEFVEGRPWMHIDAAGPLWLDNNMPYTPKGGSGWGTRTLYQLLKNLAAKY